MNTKPIRESPVPIGYIIYNWSRVNRDDEGLLAGAGGGMIRWFAALSLCRSDSFKQNPPRNGLFAAGIFPSSWFISSPFSSSQGADFNAHFHFKCKWYLAYVNVLQSWLEHGDFYLVSARLSLRRHYLFPYYYGLNIATVSLISFCRSQWAEFNVHFHFKCKWYLTYVNVLQSWL